MPKNLIEYGGSGAIPMTPFDKHDRIDIDILEKEIDFIASSGAASICTPVMVSEFEQLSEEERKIMIRVPLEINQGRCAVIANVAAVNTNLAVEYAEFAQKLGADCVIAMGPYVRPVEFSLVKAYFKAISDAISIPIMIQNASNTAQLSNEQILELCEDIENVRYIKQELKTGSPSIEELLNVKTDALEMVVSGFAAKFSPLDYNLGAMATIHACQYCDVVQRIWDLLFAGKEDEARTLHYQLLPALELETTFGMTYAKEVMVRRGIFKNTRTRTKASGLSKQGYKELNKVWEKIEPLFTWKS